VPRDLPHNLDVIRRDIEALVRKAAVEQLHLSDPNTIASIVARSAAELLAFPDAAPVEVIKARRLLLRQSMLNDFERLRRDGKTREAATIVARRYALDPHDVIEIERIAQWLRRQRRKLRAD
jgi:hypothetical protein